VLLWTRPATNLDHDERALASMLAEFISANRDEITNRCKTKVDLRPAARLSSVKNDDGVPVFLGQLVNALRLGLINPEIAATALLHGRNRRLQGFSISQVV
jgi:hypothetical protein